MSTEIALPNPYPGLRSFGPADREFFFGREQEIDELLHRLSQHHLIAVVGVSGCGKSSLIHAGLIPVLCSGLAEPLPGEWRVYSLWPGSDPIGQLERALGAKLQNQSHALQTWAAAQDANENILIFVDQFEEVFHYRAKTMSEDGGNRAALFIDLLLTAAVSHPALPVYVLLTMRTDYLGECAVFRGLSEALNEGSYLVPRLSRLGQQDAIERPAASLGVKAQPGLVQRLLNDSEGDPDKLPVLQHILKMLWENRSGELDLTLYEKVGGWEHALERDGQQVLEHFRNELSAVCRMFQWLADPGSAGRPVRRRVPARELSQISGLTSERTRTILSAFADRGFLRSNLEDDLIDFTHESVIWHWPKVRVWIAEESEQGARIRFLRAAAASKLRLSGSTLEEARILRARVTSSPLWATRYFDTQSEVDRLLDWVKESEVEEKKASDALRRGRRWLQSALVVAVLAAALIAYLAVDAHWAKQDALKQKRIAVDQALVARQLSIKAEQSETKLALEDAELKALKASGQEKDRLEKQIAQLKNSAAQLRAEAASGGQALSTAAQQIRELQMQVSEYQVEIIALKMEKSALISANPMLDIFSRRFDALDNEFSALKRGQANEQEQFGGAIELLFIIISGGASIRLYTHLSRTGPKKR